jgi:single-stranded-DNA-specific exonuclease
MVYQRKRIFRPLQASWVTSPVSSGKVNALVKEMGVHPLVAQIVIGRGWDQGGELSAFLRPRLSSLLDPFLLRDMDRAVERLAFAIRRRENICIYGDYDVDGITATVLLIRFFKWQALHVHYYIPHRIQEGYGINKEAIDKIVNDQSTLLLTVDTGISCLEEVAYAKSKGLDVIITDHHQPSEELPPAVAVINPQRKDCPYPFPNLSGVGVAFKLVHALSKALEIEPKEARQFLASHLDLVALGTIADIVPLVGENRILARYGLEQLGRTNNLGLMTILELAGLQKQRATSESVGFVVAPRLNAAGRTDHASVAVDFLLTDDRVRAVELMRYLNSLNEERRRLEEEIFEECIQTIEAQGEAHTQRVFILEGEGWHLGVVGIVASRIVERYNRPVILLALEKDLARGSGRSIAGFNLYDALKACERYLISYGGHAHAAGLRLARNSVRQFVKAMEQWAHETLDAQDLVPQLHIDADVSAEEMTLEAVQAIGQLEPYGQSNPPPVLSLRGVELLEEPRIVGKDHLKLQCCQHGIQMGAIGFSMGHYLPWLTGCRQSLDVAFTPAVNDWGGAPSVELHLRDVRPSLSQNV